VSDGRIAELDRNESTTSELLARHLPKSNIVKAFNAIQAADIVNDGDRPGRPNAALTRSQAMPLPALLYVLDLTGVAVFAISGALAGVHRGLDLFGIAVVAAVTAIGGGTLRDLVLHRHPAFWVNDPRYLYVILAATVAAVVGEGYLPSLESGLLVADAIGLGLFALSGAQIAEGERRSWIVIVLMGTMTGVAGGVIRDLLSGVIPVLLRRDIYASAAIAGIVLYLLLQSAGVRRRWAFIIGILSIVTLRLLARALNWQLPVISHYSL
jgi:uncharacterized membrane protein YeiH